MSMFTGLIETVGRIVRITGGKDGRTIGIEAEFTDRDLKIGDSIAVDGVCLTVTEEKGNFFAVDVVAETLRRTTLAHVQVGDRVNLERALAAGSRMGGHFVQGHVDGIGKIAALQDLAFGKLLRLSLAEPLLAFVVEKGSIALDGISLTVASVDSKFVDIAVIPHTWQATTLHFKKQGDAVNIEVDILAKYVKKFMMPSISAEGLTLEKLSQYGYLENHD